MILKNFFFFLSRKWFSPSAFLTWSWWASSCLEIWRLAITSPTLRVWAWIRLGRITECGIIKIRWGGGKAFGLLMFVYVWVRTEICQCEMNAEWSNKGGDGCFPEIYANQLSLTHSSKCNCLLNVTSHTHTRSHTCACMQFKAAVACMWHHHTCRWCEREWSLSVSHFGRGET